MRRRRKKRGADKSLLQLVLVAMMALVLHSDIGNTEIVQENFDEGSPGDKIVVVQEDFGKEKEDVEKTNKIPGTKNKVRADLDQDLIERFDHKNANKVINNDEDHDEEDSDESEDVGVNLLDIADLFLFKNDDDSSSSEKRDRKGRKRHLLEALFLSAKKFCQNMCTIRYERGRRRQERGRRIFRRQRPQVRL